MFCSQHWLEKSGDSGFGPGVSITYDVVVRKSQFLRLQNKEVESMLSKVSFSPTIPGSWVL